LIMLIQYFGFYLDVGNRARVTIPVFSSVALLAFSTAIFAMIPPVSTVSRSVLLLLLTYAFVFLIFVTQIFIVGLAVSCKECRSLIKDPVWIETGREKDDPSVKIMTWETPQKVSQMREKKLKETNPEELTTVDPIHKIGVSFAYFFVIHPTTLTKFEDRIEFVNLICRAVFISIFWIFLIPVFLAPVSIPSQVLGQGPAAMTHNKIGYIISSIFGPIIVSLMLIFLALYFAFGFGKRNKMMTVIDRKVKERTAFDMQVATAGWEDAKPAKKGDPMKMKEFKALEKQRAELRADIASVLKDMTLGTPTKIEEKPKGDGEKKGEKKQEI